MKEKGLDERQRQVSARTGAVSFYVMFILCTAVILIKLAGKGRLEDVAGETAILIAGGIVYLAGCIKSGIWTRNGGGMTVWQMALGSVVCSGLFSALYACIIVQKAGENAAVAKYTVIFFAGIAVLCFICLYTLEKAAQMRKRKQEEKYSE
ncbi:DUF6773 family protein [Qiania dongpingensis]|uniref:Uncharacterized protein n=1 Tax=Qiania dongpingensis TaxID=2763669 RepID=A0A7G9G2X8_9FIRM|nr:DUF6773 family protein [Qiania dongpingensis]QNM05160.1 hypothetical protein H9Q78_12030 [Qiania dongpingensis]